MAVDRVAVLLAEGFEEIEAVTIIDVLRRAEIDVETAAITEQRCVNGAHGIEIMADTTLAALAPDRLAMVVLPGGMPGSANLAASAAVCALLRRVWESGRHVAAICAAPIALHAAGLLQGRRVTCYPSFEERLSGATPTGATVECDERIVTSRGPGTALEFALTLVHTLGREQAARELREGMLVSSEARG